MEHVRVVVHLVDVLAVLELEESVGRAKYGHILSEALDDVPLAVALYVRLLVDLDDRNDAVVVHETFHHLLAGQRNLAGIRGVGVHLDGDFHANILVRGHLADQLLRNQPVGVRQRIVVHPVLNVEEVLNRVVGTATPDAVARNLEAVRRVVEVHCDLDAISPLF